MTSRRDWLQGDSAACAEAARHLDHRVDVERAYAQAQKFGASVMIAKGAAEFACEPTPHGVRPGDGATIPARTVIIATGARYRKPPLANLAQFEGAGVYYSATFMEDAQLGQDDEV